jgi:hypothetical protein
MESQHPCSLDSGCARLTPNVVPAVPKRLQPAYGRGIISGLVFPLLFRRVSEPPVPRYRTGYPAADVIEGRCRLGEVEHRLLDPGPRRIGMSLHSGNSPGRTMQSDPICRHDTTLNGKGNVDQIGRIVSEPVQFRGRLVTQGRTRTGRENGRP